MKCIKGMSERDVENVAYVEERLAKLEVEFRERGLTPTQACFGYLWQAAGNLTASVNEDTSPEQMVRRVAIAMETFGEMLRAHIELNLEGKED